MYTSGNYGRVAIWPKLGNYPSGMVLGIPRISITPIKIDVLDDEVRKGASLDWEQAL